MKKSPRFVYNTAAGSGQTRDSSSSRHPPPASSTSSASVVQGGSDYSPPRKRKLSPEADKAVEDDDVFDDDDFDLGMIEAVEEFELTQKTLGLADGGDIIPVVQNGAASRNIEERVCVLDGENKILRSEKDRLMEELRIAKEQMALMKISFASQQKTLEDQLQKQKQAQTTSTAFLKQEMQELETKFHTRHTIHTQPAPSSSSKSAHSSGRHKGASPENEQDFPSSETFLPSSQVTASQVRTVHVTRKPSLSTPLFHSYKMPPGKKPKTSQSGEAGSSKSRSSESPSSSEEGEDFVGLLDVPAELSGAQLVRLLMHKELLKFPSLNSVHHQVASRKDSRGPPPNLLSLLKLPSKAAVTMPSPSPIFKTPTSRPKKPEPGERICDETTINSSTNQSLSSQKTKHVTVTEQNPNPASLDKSGSASKSVPSTAHYSLQESMASLLKSSDCLSFNTSNPQMPHFSLDTLNMTSVKSLDPSSPDGGISLLYIMESIITNFCTTQMVKYQNSFKYMPLVSLDQASIDGSYSQSQQTSSSSSSSAPSTADSGGNSQGTATSQKSVRSSSSHTSVAEAEKQQILQALQAVQILVTFSKPVCQALLTRPPLFCIDGPPGTESKEEETSSSDDIDVSGKATKTGSNGAPEQLNTRVFIGENLVPFLGFEEGLSDLVLTSAQLGEDSKRKSYHWGSPYTPSPQPKGAEVSHIKYTGRLLDTLVQLVSARWVHDHRQHKQKEGYEVILSVLETLASIAQECSASDMDRFAPLLLSNGLLFLMFKKQAELTYRVLVLLTVMSSSVSIVKQLCNDSNNCLLAHCYALYCHFPSSSSEDQFKLHLQLTRLIFQVSKLEEGRTVLFHSNDCCSDELLKSLLTLLVELLRKLREKKPKDNRTKSRSYVLARELLYLLHTVALRDRQFTLHRRNGCDQVYIYCITAGYRAFKNTGLRRTLRDLLDTEGLLVEEEEREKEGTVLMDIP